MGGVTLFILCSIFIVLMAGCPMPDAPPTMSAPALAAGDRQLTASWAELAAIWNEVNKKDGKNTITSYKLRYGEFGSGIWTEINTGITTSHTITGLTNGVNYAVQVRAVNAGGGGAWSASSTATPIAPPTAPPTPPGTMAAPTFEVGNGLLIATWTAPTDNGGSPITGYELQYRADDMEPWMFTSSGITCARSEGQAEVCQFSFSFYPPYIGHTITTDGASYQLRVRAVNAQGNGEWSATATTTLPIVTAKLPEGMAAVAILSAEVSTIIATNDLSVSLTTVESGTYAVDESGDITITPATAPNGVNPPIVDSSTGLITVAADTTAGTYLVYGSDTGSTDILFAEYFYVTVSPQDSDANNDGGNGELKMAVTEGISTYGNTGNFNYIITTAVRDMSSVFANNTAFNGDVSGWDVSTVTTMYKMFEGASVFNGDVSGWDVSSVTTMYKMFHSAVVFNRDISGWDVSTVMNTVIMFGNATAFVQDLEEWGEHLTLDGSGKYTGAKSTMFGNSGVTGSLVPSWF